MTTDIFICTYRGDFNYLRYCLKSIQKFCMHFRKVVILVPTEDILPLASLVQDCKGDTPIQILSSDEWKGEGKGFLWHAYQILCADLWTDASFIYHFDPDCIFTNYVQPATFFADGKPVLRHESYQTLGARHPGVLLWQNAVNQCLPFVAHSETMRAHCMIYHRGLYEATRNLIEVKTKRSAADYVRDCKGTFPQTFAEFPTLGAVAMEHFKHLYYFHDCGKQSNPDWQRVPVFQAWSHCHPTHEVDLWVNGQQVKTSMAKEAAKYGITA